MREIGTIVYFGRRRGFIVGYTTVKRIAQNEELRTFAVVELDGESAAYLEKRNGYGEHDAFISLMLVDPSNFEDEEADVKIGETYEYTRKGVVVKVRVLGMFKGAYRGQDLATGKNVYISSARRLREIDG